jgi:hypothetical protein
MTMSQRSISNPRNAQRLVWMAAVVALFHAARTYAAPITLSAHYITFFMETRNGRTHVISFVVSKQQRDLFHIFPNFNKFSAPASSRYLNAPH